MAESMNEIPVLPFSLLGEFIIEFERICLYLRHGITRSLGISGKKQMETIELLLLKSTAQPLLELFLSANRSAFNLNADEDKMLKSIGSEMSELIAFRNDCLHGNWYRPYDKKEYEGLESLPGIRKRKNTSGKIVDNYMDLSAEEFRPKIERCTALCKLLSEFDSKVRKIDLDS